jgi:MYXO-CTERM domain-containing protein
MILLALVASSQATCPGSETVRDALTCSSEISDTIDHTEASDLGGSCDDYSCYTCGDPYTDEEQIAPEAVYSFTCQKSGTVKMLITDLPCDLDIYVLDSTCDPYYGCAYGSTAPYAVDDAVEFTCSAGETYYVVVEAYGTAHLDVASGKCTDDGTETGAVFDPNFTLSFDVSESTGCAEDCDDGLDNDLDGDFDCDDVDCWDEAFCCDLDGDTYAGEQCDGDDCDDNDPTVFPGAGESGGSGDGRGDGKDNDCDGLVDEGTLDYDDDGDGFSEMEGDCDDTNSAIHPDATEILGNNVDDDCDESTADTEPEDTDDTEDPDAGEDTGDGEGGSPDGSAGWGPCGCSAGPNGGLAGAALGLSLIGLTLLRRRRSA